MLDNLSIKEWAAEDRPREKLEERGPGALTEAELLAILIGSGTTNESAVSLMRRVMADCDGSLNTLGRLSIKELTDGRYKGIGKAKAITIIAACELGKRRMKEDASQRRKMTDATDIYEAFRPGFMDLAHEECHLMMLNVKHEVLGIELVSRGGMTEANVDIRLLLRKALISQATSVAMAHNHPSGNCSPSKADDNLTAHVRDACRAVGIKFIDHIIIADGKDNYYSYYSHGKV